MTLDRLSAPKLRFAADTGGTFTDLVVAGDQRGLRFFKRPTTPDDPVAGLLDAIAAAADDFGCSPPDLLARGELFIFGTTRGTNAVVTASTARTALITTRGHPDILVLREGGGRLSLFDYSQEYPDPYVPRALTFEVSERVLSDGTVRLPLDEDDVRSAVAELRRLQVEAVGVCLLWSIVNPVHERRIGELLAAELPGVPYTLSHQLNPSLREYRRASSTVIDASLKPLMSAFFTELKQRLAAAGFGGRLLILTSAGGMLDADDVARAPIHSLGSGPAAAPVAGRHFANIDGNGHSALVTDAGGTTFDVSLVRNGRIPWTRETIIGHPTFGFLTGFPSVDTKSVGAGGGSIAWVDDGGLLHVGPASAGAVPGPACYGRGGGKATVTDACVVLGYLDPTFFLGGEMPLDVDLAEAVINSKIAEKLNVSSTEAAFAVLNLAMERMVSAIEGITLNQGIDPAAAVMIGGGGGAGLYSVGIARRLGCPVVVIPAVAAALSATGALLSELRADFARAGITRTDAFDPDLAAKLLADLMTSAEAFTSGPGESAEKTRIEYSVEARYPHQVWEIEVPLRRPHLDDGAIQQLVGDFHKAHEQLFAIRDAGSPVEIVSWRASAHCVFPTVDVTRAASPLSDRDHKTSRMAFFPNEGRIETPVTLLQAMPAGQRMSGPLLIESATTTVVIDRSATVERTNTGSLLIAP